MILIDIEPVGALSLFDITSRVFDSLLFAKQTYIIQLLEGTWTKNVLKKLAKI